VLFENSSWVKELKQIREMDLWCSRRDFLSRLSLWDLRELFRISTFLPCFKGLTVWEGDFRREKNRENERSVGERNRGRRRYEWCGREKKTREDLCGGEGEERKKKVIFVKKVKVKKYYFNEGFARGSPRSVLLTFS
jgi:hypothetical protein